MKKSLFVYNEGTLQRHDNTIRFIDKAGNIKGKPDEKAYFICEQHNRNKEVCNVYNKIKEKNTSDMSQKERGMV